MKEIEIFSWKKILIVEDENDLREILSEEITYYGAEVFEAVSASTAEAAVKSRDFDVIVSDMQMPGGSGIDLFRKIGSIGMNKAVNILMTGHADISVEQIYDEGIDGIFTKPFEIGNFIDAIDYLLQFPEKRWSRKFERLPSDFNVQLKIENLPNAINSRMVNIGRGGMCVEISGLLPSPKQEVHFSFAAKDGLVLEGKAICRWVNSESTPVYIGLEFMGLSEASIIAVIEYLRKNQPKAFIPKCR